PLRHGAGVGQQCGAEGDGRGDGPVAGNAFTFAAVGGTPAEVAGRAPQDTCRHQAARRRGRRDGNASAPERRGRDGVRQALTENGGFPMGRLFAIEIIYRGIYQKTLAKNISRAIVLAAHKEGKPGISFGRYGDSPERNGIPAKNFAIVASDDIALEEGMAKYEPKEVDITIAVDDTLCKGVESWAWYGLQPVNRLLKPGGTLIVTSRETPEAIIAMCHRKDQPYNLAILKAIPSFSGLWVYKDDHTDVRILGTISRILPELFSLKSVQATIMDEWKDQVKAESETKAIETK